MLRTSVWICCLAIVTTAALAETTGLQCRNIPVANVKSIFAVAPSPVGNSVLFYGSVEEAEGELVAGHLFKLQLDGGGKDVTQVKTPVATNPPAPVWRSDGGSAYFQTDQGIYRVSSAPGAPELVWKGQSEGLAISPDGQQLAFWHIEKGSDTLVLYDLRQKSIARRWRLPDRFESDKSGWDMAFAHDGGALYARTYDQSSSTPLKQFDVGAGTTTVVNANSYAVAQGAQAVYFIAVSGTSRSLRKVGAGFVAKEFGYDTLSRAGDARSLVARDYRTKQMAVVDTQTDAIKQIGKHESAAMLADGKLLLVKGAEITVGDPSCR